MAETGDSRDKTLDGGQDKGKSVKSRPPEEIIPLIFDDQDRVAVDREDIEGGLRGRGRGRGRGQDGGRGRSARREPTMLPHDLKEGERKFSRPGEDRRFKGISDKKLNSNLKGQARRDRETVFRLTKAEVLQTAETGFMVAEEGEKTYKVSQEDILEQSALGAAQKRFSVDLPYGPYYVGYTAAGRHMLACGGRGHVSFLKCDTMSLEVELHLKETVRAMQLLHSDNMFAVAQKKYTYIYDSRGIELHCLKDQKYPTHLDFLKYHFLLVTACEGSDLHYRDISTGRVVASHRTRLGPTRCMRQNPSNGVMHLGHSNGTMTLWTPTAKEPIVQLYCHAGHVTSLAIRGNYMVTAGAEATWKVWDLRKYETVHGLKCFGRCVSDIDISMTGLVALGFGGSVQVWKDAFGGKQPTSSYMTEHFGGKQVSSVRFRPYEDVLSVGHSGGFGTLLVPGAGYANFDSLEENPYETKKQRSEKEVRRLLEKLQPDSIMLDPSQIGNIDAVVAKKFRDDEEKQQAEEAAAKKKKTTKKMRGKNKVGARMKRKNLKEGATQRRQLKERLDREGGDNDSDDEDDDEEGVPNVSEGPATGETAEPDTGPHGAALSRFYGKRRRKT